jgi:hypothetical protein
MDLNLSFQFISMTAVVLGIVFGRVNRRNFQISRKRKSALLMLNSFQTTEFFKGIRIVFELPPGAGKEHLDRLPPDEFLAVYSLIGAWERLGSLVFRQWMQRDAAMEWFQWLAERMRERESGAPPTPAYLAHRHRRP